MDPLKPNDDGSYTLVIDGETKTFTPEEMASEVAKIQKQYTADKRFQQAAEEKKKAEGAVGSLKTQITELAHKADGGDAEAYREMLEIIEPDAKAREQKLAYFQEVWDQLDQNPKDGDGGPSGPTRPQPQPQAVAVEQLPRETQELLKLVEAMGGTKELAKILDRSDKEQRKADRDGIYDETWGTVANDEILGKIVTKGGPRARKLRGLSDRLIKSRIRDEGGRYGPELRAEVVKELRGLAEEFGSGTDGPTPIPGLGTGPGITLAEAQAEKAPERVPMTDPGYSANVFKRLQHRIFHSQSS